MLLKAALGHVWTAPWQKLSDVLCSVPGKTSHPAGVDSDHCPVFGDRGESLGGLPQPGSRGPGLAFDGGRSPGRFFSIDSKSTSLQDRPPKGLDRLPPKYPAMQRPFRNIGGDGNPAIFG